MKTDMTCGPAADGDLEERLSRRFATELEQAERDYPILGRRRAVAPGRRRAGLTWPRLAMPVLAVAVLVIGGLVGSWLVARPGDTVSGPGGAGSVVLGANGIPNQIDGERVYRVGETVEPQNQGGYLLGGYVFQEVARCQYDSAPPVPCFGLGPTAGSNAKTGGIDVSVAIDVSDPKPPALGDWLGAPIVARMKGCTWDNGTPCPPVVMAIVWPTAPTELLTGAPSSGASASLPAQETSGAGTSADAPSSADPSAASSASVSASGAPWAGASSASSVALQSPGLKPSPSPLPTGPSESAYAPSTAGI
jgi:hypothetical protein